MVVTGIGLVCRSGSAPSELGGICGPESGIATITKFDATAVRDAIAGEVKDFDPLAFIEKKDVKKMDIFIQYAIAASQFAMDDGRL